MTSIFKFEEVGIYSEELGRFLSPDPLFEKFSEWTPFHFAFNNPIMYSDPTGLEPKKEKSETKLLVAPDNHFDDSGLFAMLNNMFEQQMKALKLRQDEELGKAIGLWNSFCRWKDDMWNKSQGGGRLGSGEKVGDKTSKLVESNNNEKASKEKVNKDTGSIDFESEDARNDKKERLRQKLNFVGKTSEEQEKTLDYLTDHVPEEYMETGRIITIDIGLDAKGVASKYKETEDGKNFAGDRLFGLHTAVSGTIYIASEFIEGNHNWKYTDENGNKQPYQLWMVVAHEFGHEKDFYRCFYDCGLYYIYPVEEGADREANKLRQEYGYPINKQFYRSK